MEDVIPMLNVLIPQEVLFVFVIMAIQEVGVNVMVSIYATDLYTFEYEWSEMKLKFKAKR